MPSVIKYEILLTQLNLILGCYNSTDLQRPKNLSLAYSISWTMSKILYGRQNI